MSVIGALSGGTIAALAVLAVLNVFAIVFGLSFLRANRAARAAASGEPAAKPVSIKLTRRDFFRGSLLGSLLVFGAEFGAGHAGLPVAEPARRVRRDDRGRRARGPPEPRSATGDPVYVGTGRFYVVPYDGGRRATPTTPPAGVAAEGMMALYQKCVHLGCRVPFCGSSKWFECPCHGSKYNQAGEYELGPAPRGMDRFKVSVTDGVLFVDTSVVDARDRRAAPTRSTSRPRARSAWRPARRNRHGHAR